MIIARFSSFFSDAPKSEVSNFQSWIVRRIFYRFSIFQKQKLLDFRWKVHFCYQKRSGSDHLAGNQKCHFFCRIYNICCISTLDSEYFYGVSKQRPEMPYAPPPIPAEIIRAHVGLHEMVREELSPWPRN